MKAYVTWPAEAGLNPLYFITSENRIAFIASWFPVYRLADAMISDCKLLVILWSKNHNELHQLQVPICSVMHVCSFVQYKYKRGKRRNPNFPRNDSQ
jgi:hypothetical protein